MRSEGERRWAPAFAGAREGARERGMVAGEGEKISPPSQSSPIEGEEGRRGGEMKGVSRAEARFLVVCG